MGCTIDQSAGHSRAYYLIVQIRYIYIPSLQFSHYQVLARSPCQPACIPLASITVFMNCSEGM